MKTKMTLLLVVVVMLGIGLTSYAEVKKPGTIVPNKCSENSPSAKSGLYATRVCFARIVGARIKNTIVTVSLNNDEFEVYELIPKSDEPGNTQFLMRLMKRLDRDGDSQSVSKSTKPFPAQITGGVGKQLLQAKIARGVEIYAGKFELVYTTM
jgi:hypothetical protein